MSTGSCPICRKKSDATHKPFCSLRCKEIDLNRWFSGNYAIAAVELDDVDEKDIEQGLANPESF